jgi:hypothetical protein
MPNYNLKTYPSVVFQGITFTATRVGVYPLINFTTGGVAGSEVVTTDANNNIFVQIQSGVSTTNQVISAIQATSPSLNGNGAGDLVTMSNGSPGAAVTAPATSSAMSGAVGQNTLGFYSDQTVTPLTGSYQAFLFQFNAKWCMIANDDAAGTNKVVWSWDSINNHGTLAPGQSMVIDTVNANIIYLKDQNGAPAYRLMAKPL